MTIRRLLTIVLCAFAAAVALRLIKNEFVKSRAITLKTISARAKVPAVVRSLRPNYPYSVIPGGAYSPAELINANEKDPVVRTHYSDFNLKAVHLVTLTEDRYQYVSYRLKNQVYWTRHKLRIPRGEVLLTDGCNYARTRCGNRLSSKALGNTSKSQPSERMLSLPAFRPQMLNGGPVTLGPTPNLDLPLGLPPLPFDLAGLQPIAPVGGQITQPPVQGWTPIGAYPASVPTLTGFIPGAGSSSTLTTGSVPPVVVGGEVPEPASLYLFGLSFGVSFWFLLRMMRNSRTSQRTSDHSKI